MDEDVRLPLLLDGATGTNLFKAGMPKGVCVEKWILENEDVIKKIQKAFVENGSDAIYAPTFSANSARLSHYNLEEKTEEFNKKLVELSKSVAGEKLVGGDISPTGLFIEPFGDASFSQLVSIYKQQAAALYESGVDFFIGETMMSLVDARAYVLACKKFNKPIFVTMTVDQRGKTITGANALSCLIILQELGISGFGLNCSYGPELMLPIIKEIAPFAKVPLIAKPNAGLPDPSNQNEYSLNPTQMAQEMIPLLEAGVKIIGGCCGTTPEHIKEIRKTLDSFDFSKVNIQKEFQDIILASENEIYFIDSERIEFSETIECSPDMADDLLDVEKEAQTVVLVKIDTPDEARMFAENAHMLKAPVSLLCRDELTLKAALFMYNGRAMVDTNCDIPRETLEQICKKYGAYLY